MMSVHASSYRPLCNISLSSSESDLASAQYNSPAIDMISHEFTTGFTMSGPLPLPSFVFPAKASPVKSSTPLNISNNSSCQSQTLLSPRSDTSTNMSPGPKQDPSSSPSPNCSCESPPISPRTTSSRSGFHKRGASEYIGGDLSANTASLSLKLSPKLNTLTSAKPAGSIITRRGHAHRRSAAISTGDLSIVLKTKVYPQTGGSLPNSPNFNQEIPLQFKNLSAIPIIRNDAENLCREMSPFTKSQRNTRVGFSDDVQIIPRPLSLASYDSASTIRHGHSVSNSLSSVASTSTITNSNNNMISTKEENFKLSTLPGRPRTAEPTLQHIEPKNERPGPKRSDSLPILINAEIEPPIDVLTPRSLKRWTFFGNEVSNIGSVSKPRPLSAASSCGESQEDDKDNIFGTDFQSTADSIQPQGIVECLRSPVCKKSIKKQKKVKSWAGSILSNKTKHRSQKQKLRLNSPSLPKLITTSFNDETEEVIKLSPTSPKPEIKTSYANWKPREFQLQDEPISPVIDLDAALGPFNTPFSSYGDAWDNSLRGGTRKRAMHSAAGLCGFSGPGMHYHRRTESAPEFENPRFGFSRLGSGSKMAMEDVFEEDEDEESGKTNSYEKDANDKLSVSDDDSDSDSGTESRGDISANTSNLSSPNQLSANYNPDFLFKNMNHFCEEDFRSAHLSKSADPSVLRKVPSINEITLASNRVSNDYIYGKESIAHSSNLNSIENSERDDISSTQVQMSSLHLSLPTPNSFYATSQSSLSSPPSPFLYESQPSSKAQSPTINEHEFESLLLGGPGPEMRISVDDVPSLLSSDSISGESTATGENVLINNSSRVRLRDGQRSASFSATNANRKRSSIISLSRLIYSSHGERSKLAMESCSPTFSEDEMQQKSGNLGKRISRLMKFWKKPDDIS